MLFNIKKMPLTDQQAQTRLLRLFENSQINFFFNFLRSPKAKDVIKLNPNDPTSFYFEIGQLRKACPELAKCGTHLIPLLERQGMTVRRNLGEDDKRNKFTVLSNQNLSLESSNEEIMEVWLRAETSNFFSSQSIIAKYYLSLQTENKYLHWNEDGTDIMMSTRWEHYRSSLVKQFKFYGFSVKHFPQLRHPYLCRESTLNVWLVLFLQKIWEFRVRNGRKVFEKKQKEQPKPPQKNTSSTKAAYNKAQQKQKRAINLSRYLGERQPKLKPMCESSPFQNCITTTIQCKVSEMKSLLAVVQKSNMQFEFGAIFILLEEIMNSSKQQKKNQIVKPMGEMSIVQKMIEQIKELNNRMDLLQNQNQKLRNRHYVSY